MPWHQEPMKDVTSCDKLGGSGKYALIPRFPNGETHMSEAHVSHTESNRYEKGTA